MSGGDAYGAMPPAPPFLPETEEEPNEDGAPMASEFGMPAPRPDVPMDSFAQLTGDLLGGVAEAPEAPTKASAGPTPTERPDVASTPTPERDYTSPKRAIQELLQSVVETQASDLHLIAGTKPLLRVHGDLTEMMHWAKLTPMDVQGLIYAILPDANRSRLEEQMELDCAYSMPQSARFRLNVYYQRGSIAAAFRIIPYDIKSVEDLGLPPAVRDLARLQRGLVVVTGPTGAGKSTTLAAMVDTVNRERRAHILTVEDPIEFLHKHGRAAVSQREVGPDTHGFAPALKHALRQDPDVILVGEMRDLETISTAITAAETGHLVLATLHTQDAPQTIDRIINVFPPSQQQQVRIQLAITLQGVIAQQLLPTSDGVGRVVAVEVLVVTPAVRNLIREGKTHQVYSAMQAGRKFGMATMDAALANLVADARITQATAAQYAFNAEELSRLMGVSVTSPTFGQ